MVVLISVVFPVEITIVGVMTNPKSIIHVKKTNKNGV